MVKLSNVPEGHKKSEAFFRDNENGLEKSKTFLKEKDFIELVYTGKIKEDDKNIVFDTTDKEVAKSNDLFDEKAEYKPRVICVGQGQVIQGLDKELPGKEVGKDYTIELTPEEGYGKKSAKLIQLISTSKFLKEKIQPMPGLQVNIDGTMGIIKTVSGGRTLVDFNHPLAGKDLIYDINIKKVITDDKEKLSWVLKTNMRIKDAEIKIENKKAVISTKQEIPKEIHEELKKMIKDLLPSLEEITFKKSEEKKENTSEKKENKKI